MKEVQFLKGGSLRNICSKLAIHRESAKILAGGTDLMISLNNDPNICGVLISIKGYGLEYIRQEGKFLYIGATTTLVDVSQSDKVQKMVPLLSTATKQIGSSAIRNMGTIGGNLCNASPAADTAVALLALGAKLKIKISSSQKTRVVNCERFFLGPKKTILNSDELLEEIIIPIQSKQNKWRWYKIGLRKSDTIAVISVAISLSFRQEICHAARIALGSVAPTPFLAEESASLLHRKTLTMEIIEGVSQKVSEDISPIDDVRATAWYRRTVAKKLMVKLLSQIAENISQGE